MSKPKNKFCAAFTLLELALLICIVGLIAAIAIPNRIGGSHTSKANACINNLRQIDAAANQFALEHSKTNGDAINFPNDITPYIKLNKYGKIPPCPSGGIYNLKRIGDNPTCSIGTNSTQAHVLQ
jgi:type II secretory pathway pseudopilin PulG